MMIGALQGRRNFFLVRNLPNKARPTPPRLGVPQPPPVRALLWGFAVLIMLMPVAVWAQPPRSAQGGGEGPAREGTGLVRNDPRAFQGYTLLSPMQSKTTFLMDMEGRVVRSWATDFAPGRIAYLLDNGNLLRAAQQPNPPWGGHASAGGRMQEFTWDGELVWDFSYFSDTRLPHHDFARLPNGNVILIIKKKKTADEAIAAGRLPASVQGSELQVDALVEIRPTGKTSGEVVWEWHLWDHLIQDHNPDQANYGHVAAHPELVDLNFDEAILAMASSPGGTAPRFRSDWTHMNAVAYNEQLDQLVVSIHNLHEIWVLDHSTSTAEAAGHTGGRSGKGGDLLYRWGNPRAYRAGTREDQRLFGQHDSHWIEKGCPGEGHLMIFNNGAGRPAGSYSSVEEIVLPVDARGNYVRAPGGRYGPEQAVWSYTAPNPPDFYSNFISGASRLPNGNTLICSGANGILFEVTPDKKVVWQYMNPAWGDRERGPQGGGPSGRSLFRAYRYGADFAGLAGKDLTPGKPLEALAREVP
jgi:hypothetical protein